MCADSYVFDAPTPGSQLPFCASPPIFSEGGILGESFFSPFSVMDAAPSSPPAVPGHDLADDFHDEVRASESHHEASAMDFGALPPFVEMSPAPVPDSALQVLGGADDALFEDLFPVSTGPAPEAPCQENIGAMVKQEAELFAQEFPDADIPVKAEDVDVDIDNVPEEESRPKHGPGSRRKVQEEIRDELDSTIYSLFPMEALRLPRVEFQAWRETSGIRRLTVPEQKRLAKIRRMILARVYAERTRIRKLSEAKKSGETLTRLKTENTRLRKKAAKLEAQQVKLREQVKRLLALQHAHSKRR